ncbi:PREDICTED: solute carrier organic anion transporter family member 3A1-like [Priapulus caudatus]|uniref:Solute carrier organic anion transporter family member 3A1-like n=1 Tax=Priapulus caudatus TaxID=37621 RepID=A0ABM1DX33_PRICU|nr:PREDICTED: solute carrier organic anion transporter family member 3A1-like [Priapulus caudatus]
MGGLARKSNTRDVSTVKRFFDSLKMNNIRNKFSKMENEAVRGVGDGDDNDDNAATPPPPPPRANSHLDNGGCHHIYGKTTPGDYVDAPPPPPDETAAGGALVNDTNPNNSFGSCGAGEELIEYGCGRVRPPLLRGCANIHFFLACHCALLLLYGLIYAYIASIQTTLERQFQINAKRASLLASANMIGYLPALIVVSYYGGRGHRPRYIAVGMLVVTAGSFFASLPYFAYGLKQEAQTAVVSYAGGNVSRVATEELCLRADSGANSTGWGCAGGAAAAAMNNGAYALVFAGMVMVGAGGASVVTLGFPYIDDNVTPKSSPLYLDPGFDISSPKSRRAC